MDRIKQFEPIFGEWYVESFIGAGSFGRVYKIYREELGNRFYSALKFITIPSDDSELKQLKADGMDENSISSYYETMAQEFYDEVKLMHKLHGNTNIVSFEDSRATPMENGVGYNIFIRMELLESLTAKMTGGPIDLKETARLGRDICRALSICSKQGIIHRDIKPDNIFVSKNGDYKLGDFGIARQLEKTSTFMSKKGTYNYMAPEVYKGEQYGAQCDIYSLGLVMYRLLNGSRLPFLPSGSIIRPSDKEAALSSRMRGDAIPPPCNSDEALSKIVLKACAYRQDERYASAEEMMADLNEYIRGSRPVEKPMENKSEPMPSGVNSRDSIASDAKNSKTVDDKAIIDKTKRIKKRNGLIVGIIAAVAILAISLLLLPSLSKDTGKAAYPSSRVIMSDASYVLRQNGIKGSVVDFSLTESGENEKYKTYIAHCDVSVVEAGSTSVHQVILVYDLVDGQWKLSDISKVIE